MTIRVSTAQFFSGADVEANLARCAEVAEQAAEVGADLLVLPENANRVRDYVSRDDCWKTSERIDGPFVRGLQDLAREHGIHLVAGVDLASEQRPDVHIASLLIGKDGELLARVNKHVLWDYEYTLFVPGDEPYAVQDTELGRLGLLLCADGIVPDTPRALGLHGCQLLCNSLNSRGPDEVRVHVPLRALENRVWHVSSNTVGGPTDAWPWMGGSQIVAPDGRVVAQASETDEELIWADVDVAEADDKRSELVDDIFAWRRPELYPELVAPLGDVPAHVMHGPAPQDMPRRPLAVALLQVSYAHSDPFTLTRVAGQIEWAGRQGAQLGVLPELFAYQLGEVSRDPAAAAARAPKVIEVVTSAAAAAGMWVAGSTIEQDGRDLFHTAFLVDDTGEVTVSYRKAHLNRKEQRWANAGDKLVVVDSPIGRIGLMIGDEVWLPEVARVLALQGAELIAHPCSWDRPEAAYLAATERTEENRVHLVSAARLDNPAGVGSQIVRANEFQGGEPIALMRYPTGYWTRPGFEEQLVVELDLREAHSKMMGHHLDVFATRVPDLYGILVDERG